MDNKKNSQTLLMLSEQLLGFLEECIPKKNRKNKSELPPENTEDTKEVTDEKK